MKRSTQIIRKLRYKSLSCLSQHQFVERLSLVEIDLDKNAIQRIESGQRFVTEIELPTIAKVFGTTVEKLTQQKEDRGGFHE